MKTAELNPDLKLKAPKIIDVESKRVIGVKYPIIYPMHRGKYPIIYPTHSVNYPKMIIFAP